MTLQAFDFGEGKCLEDYPLFVQSRRAFRQNRGWKYKLWSEPEIAKLCCDTYPDLWPTYKGLSFPIQRVDLAKYLVADRFGGAVADLDVLPLRPLDEIVGSSPSVFDRCSRKHVVASATRSWEPLSHGGQEMISRQNCEALAGRNLP